MDHIYNAPAFVIHIEKATQRRPFFTQSIAAAGFKDMRIFPAVNAYDSVDLAAAISEMGSPKMHHTKQGAIGCLLSHMKVLTHIVKNNIPLATVFEDDVFFHSQWRELAPRYLANTPRDFDMIFIGNQTDECLGDKPLPARINRNSTFCTHAYIITLRGARKLLHLLLGWDWWSDAANVVMANGAKLTGLFCIDIMIKNIQMRILDGKMPATALIWYCWCGVHHPCEFNRRPLTGGDTRNCGLVFQCDVFPSIVNANTLEGL